MNRHIDPNRVFKRRRLLVAIGAILTLCLIVGYAARAQIRSFIDVASGAEYSGPGTGKAFIIVRPGDSGEIVAKELVAAGVTKSFSATYRQIVSSHATFFPGYFELKTQMSSAEAISYLTSDQHQIVQHVLVKEGLRIDQVFAVLANATGHTVSEFEAAASDLTAYDLPKKAVSLEGYLFPATYDFSPSQDAKQILQAMVERMKQELSTQGVAKKDWQKVLTMASIIQKEARQPQDFAKVSRVFKNRLAIGMHLQSDATVSYGVNGHTVSTSVADRQDPNGYNTYLHAGLPIGPISAPGAQAISAALNPADGTWLYFCAINLATGETLFSTTIAEHERAVAKWRAWMLANPGWNG